MAHTRKVAKTLEANGTILNKESVAKVYPRVCGGTQQARRPVGKSKGLSPRVRGNQGVGRERIIRKTTHHSYTGTSQYQVADEPCPRSQYSRQ